MPLLSEQDAAELRRLRRKVDSMRGDGVTNTPTSIVITQPRNQDNLARRYELSVGTESVTPGTWIDVAPINAIRFADTADVTWTHTESDGLITLEATVEAATWDLTVGTRDGSTWDEDTPVTVLRFEDTLSVTWDHAYDDATDTVTVQATATVDESVVPVLERKWWKVTGTGSPGDKFYLSDTDYRGRIAEIMVAGIYDKSVAASTSEPWAVADASASTLRFYFGHSWNPGTDQELADVWVVDPDFEVKVYIETNTGKLYVRIYTLTDDKESQLLLVGFRYGASKTTNDAAIPTP